MGRKPAELTGLEFEIMQVIWKRGASSTGEVQEALGRKLAYTTVQTVLNTLHRKGKLERALDGRAFIYRASLTESRAVSAAVRNLVDRIFGGSSEELVMTLLRSREIDPERIAELSRMVEADRDEDPQETPVAKPLVKHGKKGGA
jgi:BlaI family penicillinase repressor